MNSEIHEQLRERTKQFAVRIIRLARALPQSREGDVIARQVLRSGTAVAANYRADFVSKISVVVEEADETVFWLELAESSGLVPAEKLQSLTKEAKELLAIFPASRRTAKQDSK